MNPVSHRAWLLDLYPVRGDMVLWFIAENGERLRLTDPFAPSFFVEGPDLDSHPGLTAFRRSVAAVGGLEWAGPTERTDFWSGRPRPVFEIRTIDLDRCKSALHRLFRLHPGLTYYNCDIPPEVHYGYEHGGFPTAFCEIESDGAGRLISCRVLDDPMDTGYHIPPLRQARLLAEGRLAGTRPRMDSLTLDFEGRAITWEECAPEEMLASLNAALRETDPDLIWTHGGDSVLFPALFSLAARCRVPLALDREPGVDRRLVFEGRSYISYGRVLYQAPDYPLFGRWHIDGDNSFWSAETGLEGLIEVARLSRLPVQRAARRSIGTGISSIQVDHVHRQGALIPWKKSRPEAWKSAATLLRADRGGLVYQPLTGVYEDVIELDFVSMYPTIMARCNVSPETIGCECCPPESSVPGLGYSICRRRTGMTTATLTPVIDKRGRYKALMKETADEVRRAAFKDRQGAIKWLLVCCFGYLGYRNARFGRIEAHEATCAFSREKLMQAKEVCETRGFEVLHAIVDCVWLRRTGTTDAEIASLCAEIERATGLRIAVEGRYRWIAFLPSRQDPDLPVPNRYFGRFAGGDLKFRGIEIRRHDQVPLARELQRRLLDRLTAAESLAEVKGLRADLLAIVAGFERRLREGSIDMDQLVLTRATSMEAGEYRNNSMTAVAARQAARSGLPLHAGESVRFVVLNAKDRDPDSRLRLVALLAPEDVCDIAFYSEQLRRAAATLLDPLLGQDALGAVYPPPAPRPRKTRKPARARHPDFLEGLRT